MNWYSQLKEKP